MFLTGAFRRSLGITPRADAGCPRSLARSARLASAPRLLGRSPLPARSVYAGNVLDDAVASVVPDVHSEGKVGLGLHGQARLDSSWPAAIYAPMLLRRIAFPDFCEPCLPSPAAKPPAGAGWLHEIEHGFRVIARLRSCITDGAFSLNAGRTAHWHLNAASCDTVK